MPPDLDLTVRLTPSASRDAISGWLADAQGGTCLGVRVRAIPEKGKANQALIALLAKTLKLPKRDIELLRGTTSRIKTLRIRGDNDTIAAIEAKLEALTHER